LPDEAAMMSSMVFLFALERRLEDRSGFVTSAALDGSTKKMGDVMVWCCD
jgi:hypothetical protein